VLRIFELRTASHRYFVEFDGAVDGNGAMLIATVVEPVIAEAFEGFIVRVPKLPHTHL
jgi:hypothetical protein